MVNGVGDRGGRFLGGILNRFGGSFGSGFGFISSGRLSLLIRLIKSRCSNVVYIQLNTPIRQSTQRPNDCFKAKVRSQTRRPERSAWTSPHPLASKQGQ